MKHFSLFRIMTLFILLAFTLLGCGGSSNLFVSIDGNDLNDGSINSPYLSAQKALSEVRLSKSQNHEKNFVINFREGTYRIDDSLALDSIMSGIIMQAYNDEKVIFSGGVSIPAEFITQSDTILSIDSPQGTV